MNIRDQRALTADEYEQYKISPQKYEAKEFFFEKIIEERCDQFEAELEDEGFEIIARDYIPLAPSIFNFKIICVKEIN